MGSQLEFVEYVVGQMNSLEQISYKKMFGEYAIFFDKKVVALICDDRLFVKITDAGRNFIGDVVEAPAYPKAKPSFLIEDKLEDQQWLCELIQITANELPAPKPRKKKASPNKI